MHVGLSQQLSFNGLILQQKLSYYYSYFQDLYSIYCIIKQIMNTPFKILFFSSEDIGFPTRSLQLNLQTSQGWQSSQNCSYPSQIICQLDYHIYLQKIAFFIHQYKIPKRITIYTKKSLEIQQWTKLGHTSPADNVNTDYKFRELKTVNLPNTPTYQIKFLFEGFYENKLNVFKQIGLLKLNVFGQSIQRKNDGNKKNILNQKKQQKIKPYPSEKNKEQDEMIKCIVCYKNKRNCLMTPCNHLVCCYEQCGVKLTKCPICRTEAKPIKVYL